MSKEYYLVVYEVEDKEEFHQTFERWKDDMVRSRPGFKALYLNINNEEILDFLNK